MVTNSRLILCHGECSQALTTMGRHAGSLEALRGTRPEPVALAANKELPGFEEQRLEKFCNDALSKIGDQLKKDSMDEPTKQSALEYIKNYFDDLK